MRDLTGGSSTFALSVRLAMLRRALAATSWLLVLVTTPFATVHSMPSNAVGAAHRNSSASTESAAEGGRAGANVDAIARVCNGIPENSECAEHDVALCSKANVGAHFRAKCPVLCGSCGGPAVDNATTRAGTAAAALHRANGSATLPPALQGEAQKNSEPYGSLLNRNLVYIKLPKCASSTTGGVARRIAAHRGLSGHKGRTWIKTEPGVRAVQKQFCLHAVTAL